MKDTGPPASAPTFDLLLAAGLSGVVFILAHLQALTNPYVVNDDVRQQLFWMWQWLDPELFKGDLLANYARDYVPWGVKGLYWLASWVTDPISFSKVLPGLLFVFLALCLYRIGLKLGDRRLAWTTVAVYWLMPFFLGNLAGGLARAFAAPLLAFFWLCWQEEKPWGMGAALLLQALFIPYIFLVCTLAAGLAWLASRTGRTGAPPFPARPVHFLLLTAGVGLVEFMNLTYTTDGFGPLVSYADMVNRPEFYAGGRYTILPVPSIFWELISPWEWIAPFQDLGLVAAIVVCVVLPCVVIRGLVRLDWRVLAPRLQPLWYLGLAGFLLYFLARDLFAQTVRPGPLPHLYPQSGLLSHPGPGPARRLKSGPLAEKPGPPNSAGLNWVGGVAPPERGAQRLRGLPPGLCRPGPHPQRRHRRRPP